MSYTKIMEPLSICTQLDAQIKEFRRAFYDDEIERAADISTELIKSGMALRDALWRMNYVSGERG